mmetsp:Transcript_4476/g.13660  ORF Transcript_4476/g.13660 Transcript_4476/m.13660 type:complete len:120 (+) Transcript_4476:172-531(+)|eukprot:CAMPEP_0174229182 /NCGR_PEP_ID=MMETSP0417-20130205/230_1 /TAXON_ID=242541 /ORGANISM="Mayorella sp, Strain BSH-02190019" /LENGTH=119 /DNA_ID=CAMNT_0015306705 /DNA_START=171 /DNA_END=530 /DNA_ORIENTATION=+
MSARATFKEQHAMSKRMDVSKKILEKYPDRIPVIVEKMPKSDVPEIEKKKFLVPVDITVGRFAHEIRKHMQTFNPEKALYLFVNNVLPPTAALMSQIYHQYKDEDGFLYIKYAGETTFG